MKLQDPNLDRQLRAAVNRYDQLPTWMREASTSQREQDHDKSAESRADTFKEVTLCD